MVFGFVLPIRCLPKPGNPVNREQNWVSWKWSNEPSVYDTSRTLSSMWQRYERTQRAWMLSHISPVRLFATLWTAAHQAPLSMGFSRQEYWSELPCPPPGDLPDPGTEPMSLCLLHCRWILYHWATWEAHEMTLSLSKSKSFSSFSYFPKSTPLCTGLFPLPPPLRPGFVIISNAFPDIFLDAENHAKHPWVWALSPSPHEKVAMKTDLFYEPQSWPHWMVPFSLENMPTKKAKFFSL